MKTITTCIVGAFLTLTTTLGQTPEKPKVPSNRAASKAAAPLSSEEMNLRAYIELLRSDVRKQKTAIMGEVMEFEPDEAAKFWPIYEKYTAELARLGDERVVLIKKYVASYANMTDGIADELARAVLKSEQERNELKSKYYERVKEALGGVTAARFLQVENQLLMLLDLQVAASLPVIR